MGKYPKRIKTTKRTNKRYRMKTTVDEIEPGKIRIKTTKKPRKKKE